MKITERETCRASGGKLIEVLSLGKIPMSCFPLPEEPEPVKTPLVLCLNQESGLVQLKHTVDPDEMYSQYWYFSGINQSMTLALKSIVEQSVKRCPLAEGDIVVDIASNDGTLLGHYAKNLTRVGIDPAKNIVTQNCDHFINTYFTKEAYTNVLGDRKAKIVTSICVFYDLETPIQFAKDVKEILDEDGLWVLEMSYLPTMLARNSFETIVSEHIEYYSLKSMEYILDRANMKVEHVEFNDVNGGSFRLYVRHEGKEQVNQSVLDSRMMEKLLDVDKPKIYQDFAARVEKNKQEMLDFLHEQKRAGKLVIGYGASTKGNTTMAYYDIGPDLLPYVADRNPMKFGRQTVTRIPVISEDEARAMKPDYFLAFAYHFMDEFLVREKEFIDRGGRFVSPNPVLTVLPGI